MNDRWENLFPGFYGIPMENTRDLIMGKESGLPARIVLGDRKVVLPENIVCFLKTGSRSRLPF